MMLSDTPAERAIIAGICKYGSRAYYDVADLVDANSFTIESNSMIYACLKHIIDNDLGYDVYLARNKQQVDQAVDEILKSINDESHWTKRNVL